MVGVELFYRHTMFGRAVRATAFDYDAAWTMGIDIHQTIGFSFALSSILAAMAGVLLRPRTDVWATMGFILGLKAFAVAIGYCPGWIVLRSVREPGGRVHRLIIQGDHGVWCRDFGLVSPTVGLVGSTRGTEV
jgi:hypothetical protein